MSRIPYKYIKIHFAVITVNVEGHIRKTFHQHICNYLVVIINNKKGINTPECCYLRKNK